MCCGLLLVGCASDEPAPATIREFNEPTATVDQLVEEPEESSQEVTGSMSDTLRHELEKQVQLLSVSYAADGGYLMVNFQASPACDPLAARRALPRRRDDGSEVRGHSVDAKDRSPDRSSGTGGPARLRHAAQTSAAETRVSRDCRPRRVQAEARYSGDVQRARAAAP